MGNRLFAFLHCSRCAVRRIRSRSSDARLIPFDDELSQRTIWLAFIPVLAFTFVALARVLPLYIVSTPCTGTLHRTRRTAMERLQDLFPTTLKAPQNREHQRPTS